MTPQRDTGVVVSVSLLLLLCLAGYAPVLSIAEFCFDDHLAIETNRDTWDPATVPLADVFRHDFWGKPLDDGGSHRSYRPLTVMTFRVEHGLAGGQFNIPAMHAVNVALHAGCTLLVWWVLGTALGQQVGLCAGALFAVHPVHVEAVAGLVGRSDLLSALCGLLGVAMMQRPWSVGSRAVAVLLYAVASLTKDSAVTIAAIYGLCALWESQRVWGRSRLGADTVLCVLLGAGSLAARRLVVGSLDLKGSGLLRHVENPQHFVPAGPLWYMYWWVIQGKNAGLLFFPTQLCAEYSYNCVPRMESLQDPRVPALVAGSAAFVLVTLRCLLRLGGDARWGAASAKAAGGGAGRGPDPLRHGPRGSGDAAKAAPGVPAKASSPSRGKSSPHHPTSLDLPAMVEAQILFAMALVLIPYSPVSHVFVTVGTFIAERCLYLPSMGACALMALTMVRLLPKAKVPAWAALAVVVAAMLPITYLRCGDWSSDERLFKSAVDVCPSSAKNHQQYALTLLNRNENALAVHHLWRAHVLDPQFGEPLYHLARIHAATKNLTRALALLRQCSQINVSSPLCFVAYQEMRGRVHPTLKDTERLQDTADLLMDPGFRAHQLRQAGLTYAKAKDFCNAAEPLRKSLDQHARLNNYGVLELSITIGFAPREEETFCNTAYWLATAMFECPAKFSEDDVIAFAHNVTHTGCRYSAANYEAAAAKHGHRSLYARAIGTSLCHGANQIAMLVIDNYVVKYSQKAGPDHTVFALPRCALIVEMALTVVDSLTEVLDTIPEKYLGNLIMHRETIGTFRHVSTQLLSTCISRAQNAPRSPAGRKILELYFIPGVKDAVINLVKERKAEHKFQEAGARKERRRWQ